MPIQFFDFFRTEEQRRQKNLHTDYMSNVNELINDNPSTYNDQTNLNQEQKSRLKKLNENLIDLNFLRRLQNDRLKKSEAHEFERRLEIIKDAIKVEKNQMGIDAFESKHLEQRKYNTVITVAIVAFLSGIIIGKLVAFGVITLPIAAFIIISDAIGFTAIGTGLWAYLGFNKHKNAKKYITEYNKTPRPKTD